MPLKSRRKNDAPDASPEEKTGDECNLATISDNDEAVRQVFRWILAGGSGNDIVLAASKKWPGRDSSPLIVQAMSQITASADADQDTVRGWCYEATRDLYRRMLESGDLKGAMQAVKQLHDFQS